MYKNKLLITIFLILKYVRKILYIDAFIDVFRITHFITILLLIIISILFPQVQDEIIYIAHFLNITHN